MAIIVDDKPAGPPKQYPLPSEGMKPIVLADVEELGIQQNEYYGPRREVALTWVIGEQDPEGNFFVIRRTYTASLNEKSNLFADVKDMIGKVPPSSIDIESLIGTANLGVIKHAAGTGRNAGKTFANIKAFLALRPGETFTVPKDFVRAKDGGKYGKLPKTRDNVQPRGAGVNVGGSTANVAGAGRQATPPPQEIADEDIPF